MLRLLALLLAVFLTTPAWAQRSSGSGFAIAQSLVVTNQHVVAGCSSLSVLVPGEARRAARIIAEDKDADLALIYAEGLPGPVASLRSTPARLGEQVYAFGFPLAGALSSSGNFTSGLVSALRGLGDRVGELQFTAPVQPGNSGGPLLDRSGLVIGVVQSKLDAVRAARITGDIPQNVNFAISGDVLASFLAKHQAGITQRPSGDPLETTAVAEMAQAFAFQISCDATGRTAAPQTPQSPPSSDPAEIERALALTPDSIRNVQVWLGALGHDAGSPEGVMGPATRRAIRSWQRSKGMPESGYLAEQSLAALRREGDSVVTSAAKARPASPAPATLAAPGRPGWVVDRRNGCWVWSTPSRDAVAQVAWSGACPAGPAIGPGSLEWRWTKDGQLRLQSFTGVLREGRAEGYGVMNYASGSRYEGNFQRGRPEGRGIMTFATGARYDGNFQDGKRQGNGTYTRPDGARYQGDWRDGKPEGRGVQLYANGNRYDGEWKDGKRSGMGTWIEGSGARMHGQWRNNRPDGLMTVRASAGDAPISVFAIDGCIVFPNGEVLRLGRSDSEPCF